MYMVQVGGMWSFVYKNLENRGFVLHSYYTTSTLIRLVVPGALMGTPVVSTTRSPVFTKPASGTCAHRQTAYPIPVRLWLLPGRGAMGRIREQREGGLRAGGSGRDAPAAARSTILTDEWVVVSVQGVEAPHH